jgi:hypothetical protein
VLSQLLKKWLDTHILLLVLVSLEHLEDDELCEALEALLQPLLPSHTHVNKLTLTHSFSQEPLLSVLVPDPDPDPYIYS